MSDFENSFGSILDSAVEGASNPTPTPSLPESRGPFEKVAAVEALDKMRERGMEVIGARGGVAEAMRTIEAIEGVSPAVVERSGKALAGALASLERQAVHQEVIAGFWKFVRIFGQDPYIAEAKRGEQALGAAVGVIRETGEAGRAMTGSSERAHVKSAEEERGEYEKASKPRRKSLREKIFDYAQRRIERAVAIRDGLELARISIQEQISVVSDTVEGRLFATQEEAEKVFSERQSGLQVSNAELTKAVREAEDANYRGWTPQEV